MRAALLLLVLALAACSREAPRTSAALDPMRLLAAPADPRFARAIEPPRLAFPRDHGAHPEFQSEWWYFTGNLAAVDGRELAYQLTFFRRAIAFDPPAGSPWAARDVYMAHLTICDGSAREFRAFERFERGAQGLAGCDAEPWKVWVRDWSASGELEGGEVRLAARAEEVELDLTLRAAKPVVLHGERGLSRKSAAAGHASNYYSIPRLETSGSIVQRGRKFAVSGESWLDREWFTSGLAADQVGWDWFALRFDDGTELMLYRLRLADGALDPASSGTFVARDGSATHLAAGDVRVEALSRWTSPASGASYPMRWRVSVPSLALEAELAPLHEACELDLSVRYWEGPVNASATRAGAKLRATGFVEMTGY